jgi:breast cancer 2 susceptibility protein
MILFMDFRYDREVNHGHRSAIKKILEGNSSPSLMMVLCISAIYSCPYQNNNKLEVNKVDTNEDNSGNQSLSATNRNMSANIELTDGWYVVVFTLLHCIETESHQQVPCWLLHRYSLDASLDVALLEQLEKRKLFVGQKLRVI